MKSKRKYPNPFILVLLIAMLFSLGGCATVYKTVFKKEFIHYLSFSPDGRKLLFDRQLGSDPYLSHVYDLETGEISVYQPPLGQQWAMMRYSFDGRRLVFITSPMLDGRPDPGGTQLAVMDPDGQNMKKITSLPGLKIFPSFSHSGRKVIYARAGLIRKGGRTPAASYDVHEVDIETGAETRLTFFEFFEMTYPYYFPDDKRFIFSAGTPCSFPDMSPARDLGWHREITRRQKELKDRYKENDIYVMRGGEGALDPYFVFSSLSTWPLLSADGARLYFVGFEEPEKKRWSGQIYLYSPDGRHRKLPNLHSMVEGAFTVSPNGELLATVVRDSSIQWRDMGMKIVIFRIQDGTSREIIVPGKTPRIINKTN